MANSNIKNAKIILDPNDPKKIRLFGHDGEEITNLYLSGIYIKATGKGGFLPEVQLLMPQGLTEVEVSTKAIELVIPSPVDKDAR